MPFGTTPVTPSMAQSLLQDYNRPQRQLSPPMDTASLEMKARVGLLGNLWRKPPLPNGGDTAVAALSSPGDPGGNTSVRALMGNKSGDPCRQNDPGVAGKSGDRKDGLGSLMRLHKRRLGSSCSIGVGSPSLALFERSPRQRRLRWNRTSRI